MIAHLRHRARRAHGGQTGAGMPALVTAPLHHPLPQRPQSQISARYARPLDPAIAEVLREAFG